MDHEIFNRLKTSTLKRVTLEESDVIGFYLVQHGEVPKQGTLRLSREGSKLHLEWEEP